MNAAEISRTGLDVEWRRLETIAENLANANTTRTLSGEPFRPHRLVSGPAQGFGQGFATALAEAKKAAGQPLGVTVYGAEPTTASPRRVFEPEHPHADPDGFVSYPNIDHAAQMALMVTTTRAYEANVVALNAARRMYAKALEIGRR